MEPTLTTKERLTTIKVVGLNFHENTAFRFNDNGMSISTGLNVTSEIAGVIFANPDLFEGKLFKGEKMQIYKRAVAISSVNVCKEIVTSVQKQIIVNVQKDLKRASFYLEQLKTVK